ncbi:hypothetical protein [Streptomyces achromogenes]|uniref:hypothetical protein n=1 Tax=Streptomyces achromogenes TaxID=67255 RepID=UPI003693189E
MKYFNKTGWTAYFSGVEGGEKARMRPVEAWDPETGTALIVNVNSGVLSLLIPMMILFALSGRAV